VAVAVTVLLTARSGLRTLQGQVNQLHAQLAVVQQQAAAGDV